jgi:hypothetical protein
MPLTAAASSDASHTTAAATSSGFTSRPCGFVAVNDASASSGNRPLDFEIFATADAITSVSV